jgi:hypothetical protein
VGIVSSKNSVDEVRRAMGCPALNRTLNRNV